MKKAWCVSWLCMLAAGCDYTVPLVTRPELDVDPALVGLWQRAAEGGKVEGLLVLPMSKQEYLVSFPAGGPDAMFARATLWRQHGLTLVQLDWFGTARGNAPEDKRTYQYASYVVKGDILSVRMVSTEVVDREIATSRKLARAIAANRENPKLFREEMVFRKQR